MYQNFLIFQVHPSGEEFYDDETSDYCCNEYKRCKNYVIIRLVSMMEIFFTNQARRIVDEQQLDISDLVDEKSLQEALSKGQSKGQLIATNFDFARYSEISRVFSKFLIIDFFGTVKALDARDRYWYVVGAISMDKNWDKFQDMFELRNDIVHEMKNADMKNRDIRSLCDNVMNVIDAAFWIFHSEFPKYEQALVTKMREQYRAYRSTPD